MDMTTSMLYNEFRKLSLNSIKSVQSGHSLSELDSYLHVERSVETELYEKMKEIEKNGGGIVLLVGSAGDGKSHLLSRARHDFNWVNDYLFYNDATASCSPSKTAVQTLKEALADFSDASIETTTHKLVLAINLGKLNAFVEDIDVKNTYSKIIRVIEGVIADDDKITIKETSRIKVILFNREQMFEFDPGKDISTVKAPFLSEILKKIVDKNEKNPFYRAYLEDQKNLNCEFDPVYLNFEMLQSSKVRNTIVKGIIEAIVRFKLIITPREFLDFIYSIVIPDDPENFNERKDCYRLLLPSLLYRGGTNPIQKAFFMLDPVIYSSIEHNNILMELFTSYTIPEKGKKIMQDALVPQHIINIIDTFYKNNGRQLIDTTKFVFRLLHILEYHSECRVYTDFINLLIKILNNDRDANQDIYIMVEQVIPRHFGSFYRERKMIPLGVQGGEYKLFANLDFRAQEIDSPFDLEKPSQFPLWFKMKWKVGEEEICLKVDYQLYSYLKDLEQGRLVTVYENERNLLFDTFLRELVDKANMSMVTIVDSKGKVRKLQEGSLGEVMFE